MVNFIYTYIPIDNNIYGMQTNNCNIDQIAGIPGNVKGAI